jgi:hypothetical protein
MTQRYGPCTCDPVRFDHVVREIISRWLDGLKDDDTEYIEDIDLGDIAVVAGDIRFQHDSSSREIHEPLSIHAKDG